MVRRKQTRVKYLLKDSKPPPPAQPRLCGATNHLRLVKGKVSDPKDNPIRMLRHNNNIDLKRSE